MKIFQPLQVFPVFTVQLHFNSYQTITFMFTQALCSTLGTPLSAGALYHVTTGYVAPTYLINIHLTSSFPTACF